MFQVVTRHLELVFFLLTSPKFELGEFEKVMFQGVAWHFELISPSWSAQNATCVRSKKRCFKVSNGILNLFSASGLAENAIWWRRISDYSSGRQSLGTHYLLLTSPKCDLGEVVKDTFQGIACHFELSSGFVTIPKCDLGEFEKAMFQGLEWHSQIFSDSGLAENAICWIRKSDDSSCQMSLSSLFLLLDQPKLRLF